MKRRDTAFQCRVCGHLGPEKRYCPGCLAETMVATDEPLPDPPERPPFDEEDPVVLPIDGTLDLHTVRPAEVAALVSEYLEACAARDVLELRIVHGKGTGALRRTVEAVLGRSPLVLGFRAADEAAGGWGATLVTLRPRLPVTTDEQG
jgi:dsDNA-specific endonuclease/ATPase MutS2